MQRHITLWEFHDKFLEKMLSYNTSNSLYHGYGQMSMAVEDNQYQIRNNGRP